MSELKLPPHAREALLAWIEHCRMVRAEKQALAEEAQEKGRELELPPLTNHTACLLPEHYTKKT